MPTNSLDPQHVVVVLPDRSIADLSAVLPELVPHAHGRFQPYPTYPVRRTALPLHRRRASALWTLVRRPDGIAVAAGGPRRRLDLHALSHLAGWQAHQRWQAWKTHVAAGTPRAREAESFLTPSSAQHGRAVPSVSPQEARRRFEAQPRVLAMLAVNSQRVLPFRLDPDELAAFQAGEQVYCTLAAQQAVVGQLLVLPDGTAYRPVTASVADRLRYLRAALDVVHHLSPDQHLAALTRTTTP